LKLRALALEALAIGLRGAERLALREKIVAGEAVLDVDDVAHLSEAPDALKKDDLHVRGSFYQLVPPLVGGCPRWRKPSKGSARPRIATTRATKPNRKIPR